MAVVRYDFNILFPLNQMLPANPGVAVNLNGLPATPGLYLILNQQDRAENRYMGISQNVRDRFQGRQGACFELGFSQQALNNIYAFVGTMTYQNTQTNRNPPPFNQAPGYVAGSLQFQLDNQPYDLEHLFIKAAQYAWPNGTITNTQKTGVFTNTGANPIDVIFSWPGQQPNQQRITIPNRGQLV
ncbi:hypothetical protein [Rivihabitans pingtungensis]|uniref:hypothetical protein n=1 Tax=Rivihabitans pingtungensis TaxID=1054498 RepID=UPI002357BE5A|nr:hypothetical protein [Rivihabitans pingtungensis]MCK6436711.1 hypothetical protein [Rivihabitans pingtungensis]